jgi:hypothetical protein
MLAIFFWPLLRATLFGHKALASPSTSEFRQKNPFHADGLKAGLRKTLVLGQAMTLAFF